MMFDVLRLTSLCSCVNLDGEKSCPSSRNASARFTGKRIRRYNESAIRTFQDVEDYS